MVSITVPMEEEFKARIEQFPWVNWSEAAREEVTKRKELLERFEEAEKILEKSKLAQEEADKLADKVNLSLAKKYEKLLKGTK